MRVAILCDDLLKQDESGGAEAVALTVAAELMRRGHEVLIVTTTADRRSAGKSAWNGIPVQTIFSPFPDRLRGYVAIANPPVLTQLKRILAAFAPDVVHAHNIQKRLSYWSLRTAKKLGARVVVTCHDVRAVMHGDALVRTMTDLSVPATFDYRISPFRQLLAFGPLYNPLRNRFIRHVFATYVDRVIAVSDALREVLRQNDIENVDVVRNGVDARSWQVHPAAVAAFKKKHAIGNSAILYAGRICPRKGSAETIEAFAQTLKRVPSAQLVMVGAHNRNTGEIRARARELGIENALIFTGWLAGEELRAAYHAASLVISPSVSFDSLAMITLEGMACAKPVIATCFGGAREAVRHGVTGYIINPHDVNSFSARLEELLVDVGKARRFGDAGQERAMRDFTLASSMDRLEHILATARRASRASHADAFKAMGTAGAG